MARYKCEFNLFFLNNFGPVLNYEVTLTTSSRMESCFRHSNEHCFFLILCLPDKWRSINDRCLRHLQLSVNLSFSLPNTIMVYRNTIMRTIIVVYHGSIAAQPLLVALCFPYFRNSSFRSF
jgi:hypothetical protein